MWSVKKGNPKSSWICTLPVYQGALVAMRRRLDGFLILERAAGLQTGHAWSIAAEHHSWWRDHFRLGEVVALPVSVPLSQPVSMSRPIEPCIKGHSKITGCSDPLDWLTEKLNWSGFPYAPNSLNEKLGRGLRDIDGHSVFSQSQL